ncbi:MAG: MBOAT family protein [Bacteroidetes bacterium]|nr:MBOAT family protein [Bacteroidota bacterium]
MLFNSIDFAIFLPIVFLLYWYVLGKNLKWQNLFIVFASYLFYGWWDWRFLTLIFFSTIVDYFVGVWLLKEERTRNRKILLAVSIIMNLGLLGFFKYFNFFLDNLSDAFSLFGSPLSMSSLNIIVPVGISFYTFQTLSYSIDVYKKKLTPTTDFMAFAAFVSFFPQLVAGPIERASNLLPQFYIKRTFDYTKAVDGLRQILWGLFKKIVIADNAAQIANELFNNTGAYSGSSLAIGAVFFTFQIYGDFSGYSDIAIGTSRLFGFNLKQNFAFPYFSRDIAEFWRRWHISLSTWFRDYVYIPMGGSRGGTWIKVRNTFALFIISGFWHGASWTFIVWGGLNALYFLPLLLLNKNRKNTDLVAEGRLFPSIKEFVQMGATFCLTCLAWVFFRADNLSHAFHYLSSIFSKSFFSFPEVPQSELVKSTLVFILLFTLVEWIGRKKQYAIEFVSDIKTRPIRYSIYLVITLSIIAFGNFNENEFIYFQF